VDDDDETAPRRHAHGNETGLIGRVFGISDRPRQRVAEDSGSVLKGDAMLTDIAGGLGRVPFELHRTILGPTPVIQPSVMEMALQAGDALQSCVAAIM
jgi:hypothetical protein